MLSIIEKDQITSHETNGGTKQHKEASSAAVAVTPVAYSQGQKAANEKRAQALQNEFPDRFIGDSREKQENYERIYSHRFNHREAANINRRGATVKVNIASSPNNANNKNNAGNEASRSLCVYEEELPVPNSTFKDDYRVKHVVLERNPGRERDLKSSLYLESADAEASDTIISRQGDVSMFEGFVRPQPINPAFLTYIEVGKQYDQEESSCYKSDFTKHEGNHKSELSYHGISPRLFHNQHHIHFGNEQELGDEFGDSELGNSTYRSIQHRSYRDFSHHPDLANHKVHSKHEPKARDPRRATLLQHCTAASNESTAAAAAAESTTPKKSVQKEDFTWKGNTLPETERTKRLYLKELKSTHFSLGNETGSIGDRRTNTTQASSFNASQFENFERAVSFKHQGGSSSNWNNSANTLSSIPFDELDDPEEQKNIHSLYKESYSLQQEAQIRALNLNHERAKKPIFNHSEIIFGSDEEDWKRKKNRALSLINAEDQSAAAPAVQRMTAQTFRATYKPLNLFESGDEHGPLDPLGSVNYNSPATSASNNVNTTAEIIKDNKKFMNEQKKLANQTHFTLGFDAQEYSTSQADSYTGFNTTSSSGAGNDGNGGVLLKIGASRRAKHPVQTLKLVDVNATGNYYETEYHATHDPAKLENFKAFHSPQRSNISNGDNYFPKEAKNPAMFTSHQISYVSPEYVHYMP